MQFVKTPVVGVPRSGEISIGFVLKTRIPVPVLPSTAVLRFDDDGVVRKSATPAPRLDRPPTGSPVQLVKVPEVGVPRIGAMSVGLLLNTIWPAPVIPEGTTEFAPIVRTPPEPIAKLFTVTGPVKVDDPVTARLPEIFAAVKFVLLMHSEKL